MSHGIHARIPLLLASGGGTGAPCVWLPHPLGRVWPQRVKRVWFPPRFLAYKLPWPRHSPPAEGMRYMYQDARSGGWVPGRTLMNSTQSAVGRTLLQLYQGANRRVSWQEGDNWSWAAGGGTVGGGRSWG